MVLLATMCVLDSVKVNVGMSLQLQVEMTMNTCGECTGAVLATKGA